MNLVGVYIINWLYVYATSTHVLRKVTFYNGKEVVTEMKALQPCVFDSITTNGILDFLRCLLFVNTLNHCTAKDSPLNPLPLTWVFEDFPKFLFEPTCIEVFWKYLRQNEPENLTTLEKLMKLYLTSYQMSTLNSLQSSIKSKEEYERRGNYQYDLSEVQETEREYHPSKIAQELNEDLTAGRHQLQGSLLKNRLNTNRSSFPQPNRKSVTNSWRLFDT